MVFVYADSYCVTHIAANFEKWTLHRAHTHKRAQRTNHGWMVKKRDEKKILSFKKKYQYEDEEPKKETEKNKK